MSGTSVLAISCAIVASGAIAAPPCAGQTPVASLDELRRELAAGDRIIVVPSAGEPFSGRLLRVGDADLEVGAVGTHASGGKRLRDVTIPLDAIRSLERPRDPVRDGVRLGALVGAAIGGAMFVSAFATDRNEADEWGPIYAGAAAALTGMGALAGWAVDAAKSKPHIRFDAPSSRKTTTGMLLVPQRRGIAIAVSFSR